MIANKIYQLCTFIPATTFCLHAVALCCNMATYVTRKLKFVIFCSNWRKGKGMGNALLYSLSLSSFSHFLLSTLFLSFSLPPYTLSPFPSSCKLFITLVGLELKMNKQRSATTSLTVWRLLFFLFVKINFFVLFYLRAISSHVTRN